MEQIAQQPARDATRRPGETTVELPTAWDAGLFFIGLIRTPWINRRDCPKRGVLDGPVCRVEIDPRWTSALDGIEPGGLLQVLYWMHLSRRDLSRQNPRSAGKLVGTFATRSPVRPNPIASSIVRLQDRIAGVLMVRGLDCVDRTPLIDIKPERCPVIEAGDVG